MLNKFKSLFADPPSKSKISPLHVKGNAPIKNPSLIEAMERLRTDGNKASEDTLLLELNKANYLAAILTEETTLSKPIQIDVETIEKTKHFKLLEASDDDGNTYLALFTDREAVFRYVDQPVEVVILSSFNAWYWALNMGEHHGIIINPAEHALPLSKWKIQYLSSAAAIPISENVKINYSQ